MVVEIFFRNIRSNNSGSGASNESCTSSAYAAAACARHDYGSAFKIQKVRLHGVSSMPLAQAVSF
jgi:hypothetical protein